MTKKTRLIILLICVLIFLASTPLILLYSLGYRINFTEGTIVATGGIYVKVDPKDADIIIDSKIQQKPGLFSSAVFAQNLLPKAHEVIVKKDGYHEYYKNLQVKENEVTKLENVVLFKQDITFSALKSDINYFSIAPDNTTLLTAKINPKDILFTIANLNNGQQESASVGGIFANITDVIWSADSKKALLKLGANYFLADTAITPLAIAPVPYLSGAIQPLFNPQDSTEIFFVKSAQGIKNVYSSKNVIPIIEDIIAYLPASNGIVWLSKDGFLYSINYSGTPKTKLSAQALLFKKNSGYRLKRAAGQIFLLENQNAYILNSDSFEPFYNSINEIKTSPNERHILYTNDYEALYSVAGKTSAKGEKILIQRFPEKMTDAHWLNDDYIALNMGGKIMISEIDARGNVNAITLPQMASSIYFNYQDKKLYVLAQSTLIASEGLVP